MEEDKGLGRALAQRGVLIVLLVFVAWVVFKLVLGAVSWIAWAAVVVAVIFGLGYLAAKL